ncbi:MAG: TatD family hydrolase [Idiomarinaceae bacterium HL-53]|nr:MAG: TatD family hydrolase [Idiomarinaceae bacterium HL-53]
MASAHSGHVSDFVVPGVHRAQWQKVLQLSQEFSSWHIGFGLHPYFIDEHVPADIFYLEHQLQQHQAAFVGEIGIDFTCANLPMQRYLFERQIELAAEYERTVVMHHRKSQAELQKYVKKIQYRSALRGMLHAFSGSYEQAMQWHELGFKLGVGGVITYERAKKTRDAIRRIPLTALVLETDSPDMPLMGQQGRRNEPKYVCQVFKTLCAIREEPEALIAKTLLNNTRELFSTIPN